jgi:NAD(P)-dependent dehydrogenase (short-subunit alcohol dehydrogenase family)
METRVALITGGGRGLGRVMALALMHAGHRVILSSTDQPSLDEVVRESGAGADRIRTIRADLAVTGEAERLADAALRPFGHVDILVNNAGFGLNVVRTDYLQRPYRFWESDRALIERFFAVNTIAAMILAIRLAPAMVTRGWGRIVANTTSLDSMLRFSLYGGSKAALEAETAIMAGDLAGTGVTANVLVPGGGAGTRMTDQLGLPRDVLIPAECMGPPMAFIASDESGAFTGRRILANRWVTSLPPREAAARASDPIAWTGVGTAGVQPAAARKTP